MKTTFKPGTRVKCISTLYAPKCLGEGGEYTIEAVPEVAEGKQPRITLVGVDYPAGFWAERFIRVGE